MRKNLILMTLLLATSTIVNAQEGWFKQLFNEKVTIGFPLEGKRASESTYIAKDSLGAVYGVVMAPLDQKSFTGQTATDSVMVRYKFIDIIVNELKAKMPTYAIGDVKISKLNDLKVYHLEGINAENKSQVFVNIFLINDISYSLTCFLPNGTNPKNKDLFLSNIMVEK